MNPIRNINLAGAGNVATHLAEAFFRKGFAVRYIYNRTPDRGKKLARKVNATWVESPEWLHQQADLIVLAVSDSAIPMVSAQLHADPVLVVHTSGSADIQLIRNASSRTGVFYPLQTFRKGKRTSLFRVPVCIEAADNLSANQLWQLAGTIGATPYAITSEQRRVLHIGAVLAGNFTNFLYAMAEELASEYQVPFDLLKPLIRQTAANARSSQLFAHQTGPAVREDHFTLALHKDFLSRHPDYLKLYDLMTQLIMERKQRYEL